MRAGTRSAVSGAVAFVLIALAVTSSRTSSRRVELTYWEEQTGQPSPQQRWYQHMSSQDAGPPIGSLGQGWDGKDRYGLFPGDYGYVSVKKGGRTTELSELDPLAQGSGAYVDAHKYLEKLQAQSVRGQKAYEAKKAAERQEAMKKGIKQAQKLYKHTLKHGYGKDLDNKYWQTLEVMNSESHK